MPDMRKQVVATITVALAAGWLLWGGETPSGQASSQPPMTDRQRVLMVNADMGPWQIDEGALQQLVELPTAAGNAAEHYAKMEALYNQEKIADKAIMVSPQSQGVEEILAATRIRACQLTPAHYPAMEKGTNKQPDVAIFLAYMHALLQRAEDCEKKGDILAASRIYKAGLVWGWHFASDRPNLATYMLGLIISRETGKRYARFLQRNLAMDKARRAESYEKQMRDLLRRVSFKSRITLGDCYNFNCLYAVIRIAKEDPEPFWRQEAVMRLGVLRHGAPNPLTQELQNNTAYQRLAEETLTQVAANDAAPWIRKLSVWVVQNVTPERFAEMRRKIFSAILEERYGEADDDKKDGDAAGNGKDDKKP